MGERDGTVVETALRQADMAMYWAKTEGRGRFRFFDREMDRKLQQRVELEAEIRGAIKAGQIVPYYQPIVDLDHSGVVGFEVLGRGIARHGHPVHLGDQVVGCVTSGTYAPYVKKNIGLCYLPAARSAVGTDFDIDVRGRRLPARVVPTPFYKRAR